MNVFDHITQLVVICEMTVILFFFYKSSFKKFEGLCFLVLSAGVFILQVFLESETSDCTIKTYLLVHEKVCHAPIVGAIYACILWIILVTFHENSKS